MGFWSRVKGWFDSGAEKSAGGLLGSILQSGAPARRGTVELLRAYRTHPWLHAIVWRIAQAVAAENFLLFRSKTARAAADTKQLRSAIAYAPADATPVLDHPLLQLLANPSPIFTRATFWALVNAFLDVKGEAVLVVERGANGLPVELWVVPPHWLAETPHSNFPFYRFSWNAWQRTIAERDVLYLRHPDLEQPYQRGVGTAETLADEIDIDEFATKHLKQWFFNRALPDVFLSVEGIGDEKEAKRYEEKLRQKHGGAKAFQVHVTGGKVELKTVGHTFREQMLPEIRTQSRDVALQVYGVPPEIMGIVENSNRATIDAATLIWAKFLIVPRLSFIADAFTKWARVEYSDETLCLGFLSPIPGDATFSLSVMSAQPGLFTKNEWRELAGKPPVAGWDAEYAERAPAAFAGGGDPSLGPGKVDDEGKDPKGKPADDEADEADEEEEKAMNRGLLRVVNAIGQ